MKQYEDKKFEIWREQVEANLMSYLKRNLLSRPPPGSATTKTAIHSIKDDDTDEDSRTPVQCKDTIVIIAIYVATLFLNLHLF